MARRLASIGIAAAMLAITGDAVADRRLFTSTYEYRTLPEGQTSFELWHTESRDTWDSTSPQRLQHALEIEHGVTEKLDLSLHTVFAQTAGGTVDGVVTASEPFRLAAMKVESRYRFADRGELPVDMMADAVLAKSFGESVYEVQARGVFARDFDQVTAVLNVVADLRFGNDAAETGPEVGWAAGATYELHPKLNVGAEMFGVIEDEGVAASLGPAIAVAPHSNFWLTFTAGFGMTDEAPALSGRLLLGVEL